MPREYLRDARGRFASRVSVSESPRVYSRAEHEQLNVEADRKSRRLLESLLDGDQRKYYRAHGAIPVTTNLGNRYMLITSSGATGNVVSLDSRLGYCAHLGVPAGRPWRYVNWGQFEGVIQVAIPYPLGDHFISQLLTLQSDEHQFLQIAHRYGEWRGRTLPGETTIPRPTIKPVPRLNTNWTYVTNINTTGAW